MSDSSMTETTEMTETREAFEVKLIKVDVESVLRQSSLF